VTSQRRVVAAIDFGTHGTGFAWATVSRENTILQERRINYFDLWGQQTIAAAKNRSAVLVEAADGRYVTWGYQAVDMMNEPSSQERYRLKIGFKMALQPDPWGTPSIGGEAGLTIADAAADSYHLAVYVLRQVYVLACDVITRGPYVEDDIAWCITIPAIWEQLTRDVMYKAAVDAGLPNDPDRLLLVKEPAAAALYCVAKGDILLNQPGTRFMVIDAGGGTLDITSYLVDDGGRLHELAAPNGERAGSEYLNRAFMDDVLTPQLGADFISHTLSRNRGCLSAVMDTWERAKRVFAPGQQTDIVIPLSAPLYAALVRYRTSAGASTEEIDDLDTEIVVPYDDAARIFDKVVDQTIVHVESCLREMRELSRAIGGEVAVLVGGFAESPYLQARLRTLLRSRDVQLLIPERPSVAVLAGAVHFAYDSSTFLTWRAPFTCGVSVNMPFREGQDPVERKVVGSGDRQLCRDRFDVFVENRQSIGEGHSVTRPYYPVFESQREIVFNLLSCPRADVQYADDSDVKILATLRVDLSASMHLPAAQRGTELTMHFGQGRITASAKNCLTGTEHAADIEWRPTW
jgi:hypothetical protein